MPEGVVQKLFRERGFGFVGGHGDHKGVFFHKSKLAPSTSFEQLSEGARVSFDLVPNKKDKKLQDAVNVCLFDTAAQPVQPTLPHNRPTEKSTSAVSTQPSSAPAVFPPYRFSPIDVKLAVTDSPVWHDGSGVDLLSGEILCSLEAKTPLLSGNARYTVKQANREQLRQWGFGDLPEKKQIAEPLRLPDGRVLIAGSALKGMIRHSLGALLSAPMERVKEHHYTYRPNLDFTKGKERLVVRPALVTGRTDCGEWEIEVFRDPRAAIFVRNNARRLVEQRAVKGVISGTINNIKTTGTRVLKGNDGDTATLSHRLATYKGGIDGKGLLAEIFEISRNSDARKPFTYELVLLPTTPGVKGKIPKSVYANYIEQQLFVLANHEHGHLATHSLPMEEGMVAKVAETIKDNAELNVGQLIYIETNLGDDGKLAVPVLPLSLGHHFRYRWAYTSSVRRKNGELRKCLTVTESEKRLNGNSGEKDAWPAELTGARLLFGYVRNDKPNEELSIGKGLFERLAGRVAFNHAVSEGVPKFLGDAPGYCVPLKILGQPKPSAWEFYLHQPDDRPVTYGDLPGDEGGELAGRKFYLHQPKTGIDDIRGIRCDENTKECQVRSDQATLARFICASGSKFKFAVRFSQLRRWELGAMLAVLEPHRLDEDGKPGQYAHKLGLGRPLGMGSVSVEVDVLRIHDRRESDVENIAKEAIEELLGKFAAKQDAFETLISRWLELHEYADRGRLDYPHDGNNEIYGWHTKLRRDYSKLRRENSPQWDSIAKLTRPACEIPRKLENH